MNYKDSIIIERLRKQHGEYFCYVVHPWHMSGWDENVDTAHDPTLFIPNASNTVQSWLTATTSLNGPENLIVVSASSADSEMGTGAQVIRLVGINENFELDFENVKMDGTNDVTTTKKWAAINSARVIEGNTTSGHITVKAVGGTVVVASIYSAMGTSASGTYTVPPGRELYLTNFRVSMESSSEIRGRWYLNSSGHIDNSKKSQKFPMTRVMSGMAVSTEVGENRLSQPLRFGPLSQVSFVAEVVSGTADISVFAEGFEVITNSEELQRIYKKGLDIYKYKYKESKRNRRAALRNPNLRNVNAGPNTKQVK